MTIAPAVGDSTAVLPLAQRHEAAGCAVRTRFGADKVSGRHDCYIGARVDAETGDIVHFGDFHRIAYGEKSTAPANGRAWRRLRH